MLLDLVWLMRHGDAYGAGVAAAALAQYDSPDQLGFLAAVAAMPAVLLLISPHSYGKHSAARLLAGLAHVAPAVPEALTEAGAVAGLLPQLDLSLPFPYQRASASAALAGLCQCPTARAEARAGGAVRLLKQLVLEVEPVGGSSDVRFSQRDAAACLLALGLEAQEADTEPAVSLDALLRYSSCSHAWLRCEVDQPTDGYASFEEAPAAAAAGEAPGGAAAAAVDDAGGPAANGA